MNRTVGEIEAATGSDSDEEAAYLGLVNSQVPNNGWVTDLKITSRKHN